MNAFLVRLNSSASVAAAAPGLILIGKLTLLLSLAWLIHPLLARYNPRWRVALWRGVLAGLVLIGLFSVSPPLLRWRILPGRAATEPQIREHLRASLPAFPEPFVRFVKGTLATVRRTPGISQAAEITNLTAPVPVLPGEILSTRSDKISFAGWLFTFWAIGCVISSNRLFVAMFQLSRLRRSCEDVAPWIADEAREVSIRVGCKRRIHLRESSSISTPCLFGIRRPTLLIPGTLIDSIEPTDLRAILAHEMAHARNHDLFWNLSAHLASIILWFHPLIWKLRSAHATACEAVCDAVAADCLGDTRAYVRTLARIALGAIQPPPAQGLAMVRISEVLRRVEALNRHLFPQPLPRNALVASGVVGAALAVLIGGIRLSRADPPPTAGPSGSSAKGASKGTDGRIKLRVVDDASGKPMEGVEVAFQRYFDGKWHNGKMKTDKDGAATIDWKTSARLHHFTITARKPKFVPIHLRWDGENRPIELPAEEELRLEPGTPLDGQVNDEKGKPIAGASVEISIPATSPPSHYYFQLANLKTDASGRWHLDEAPAKLTTVLVTAKQPNYRPQSEHIPRSKSLILMLKKGLKLTGKVLDLQGKPIKGAQAIIGSDIWGSNPSRGKTDEQGRFILENCPRGEAIVTVQADGYAPQIQPVLVDEQPISPEFRLGTGAIVRVKFVEPSGKPIEGASLNADTWHGHRSLDMRANSGPDGRIEWRGAPPDPVIYHCYKPGLMRINDLTLSPSDSERVITMYPPLEISGRVTDARSGRPVPSFRAIKGIQFRNDNVVHWMREESAEFADGQYTMNATGGYAGHAIRIEARGYKPAVSRVFKPEDGKQTFDFSLESGNGIEGIVVGPDDRPIKGIEVAVATQPNQPYIQNAEFGNNGNIPRTTTDAEGKFAFPVQETLYTLVALGDAGYAMISSTEFNGDARLRLKPWGRIRGQVQVGSRLGTLESVSFQVSQPNPNVPNGFVMLGGNTVKADEKGRFIMDRVFPGKGSIGRVVETDYGNGMRQQMPCWMEPVEIIAGETTRVTVGGRGRPVVGRVILDSQPDVPFNWTRNTPIVIQRRRGALGVGPRGWERFASNFDRDGNFRVDDVPAGDYEISLSIDGLIDRPRGGFGADGIGQLQRDIAVPEIPGEHSDDPLDVGTLTATLFKTLKVGEASPDIRVTRLDGKPLQLGEFRGKVLLLHFWGAWAGPDSADLPALKDIERVFGADARFRLVGLSCDQLQKQAEDFVAQNGMTWTQGFAGQIGQGAAESYGVRSLPSSFLIGQDGKILAKNQRGPQLKQAVENALKGLK